jgi:hypothetical protein
LGDPQNISEIWNEFRKLTDQSEVKTYNSRINEINPPGHEISFAVPNFAHRAHFLANRLHGSHEIKLEKIESTPKERKNRSTFLVETTDVKGLLAVVISNPDHLSPRLAYRRRTAC